MRTGKVKTYSSVTASDLLVDFSSILCVTKENQWCIDLPRLKQSDILMIFKKLLPDVTEDSDRYLRFIS
jgi:hypothetical protein